MIIHLTRIYKIFAQINLRYNNKIFDAADISYEINENSLEFLNESKLIDTGIIALEKLLPDYLNSDWKTKYHGENNIISPTRDADAHFLILEENVDILLHYFEATFPAAANTDLSDLSPQANYIDSAFTLPLNKITSLFDQLNKLYNERTILKKDIDPILKRDLDSELRNNIALYNQLVDEIEKIASSTHYQMNPAMQILNEMDQKGRYTFNYSSCAPL